VRNSRRCPVRFRAFFIAEPEKFEDKYEGAVRELLMKNSSARQAG
jgi:hypothetical protein